MKFRLNFFLFVLLRNFCINFQVQAIAKFKSEKANVVQLPSVVETRKKEPNKQQQQHPSTSSASEPQRQPQPPQQQQRQQQPNSKVFPPNKTTNIAQNGHTTSNYATLNKVKQSELLKVMEMPTPSHPHVKVIPIPAAATASAAASVTIMSRSATKPSPIANSRRRKSISTLVASHSPAKAMMISNRRDTMIETCYPKFREHHPPEPIATDPLLAFQQRKSAAATATTVTAAAAPNIVRSFPKIELPASITATSIFVPKSSNTSIQQPSQKKQTPTNDDVHIIEAFVPHNVSTIKGTRNVMNAISQGAQLVKVIDSKVVKQPITISNLYVNAPAKSTVPATIQIQQPQQQPQQFGSMKTSNIDYLSKFVGNKGHKIEIISLPPLPPPSARNPNIIRNTNDKTIMHVSPHLLAQRSNLTIRPAPASIAGSSGTSTINTQNHHTITTTATAASKYHQQNKNHVVQVVQPQPRMVTIHPNSTILNSKRFFLFCLCLNLNTVVILILILISVPARVTTVNEPVAEYVYEEPIADWQNYDPSRIEQPNGYVKIINRSHPNAMKHDYQDESIAENIIYDDGGDSDIVDHDDIITEEYIMDNVIEVDTDSGGTIYTANDNVVTYVSNNV